jgi:hypothetical protein
MAQSPKRPPVEVLKVGVGSGGGAVQECDAIKYDGKLWLVPQWLDEPGRGSLIHRMETHQVFNSFLEVRAIRTVSRNLV